MGKSYHILGETLSQCECVTLALEVPDGESILIGITAGEALVSHIEERIMLFLLDNVTNLLPLRFRWVDACGVVRAGVQKNNAGLRSRLKIGQHTLEV